MTEALALALAGPAPIALSDETLAGCVVCYARYATYCTARDVYTTIIAADRSNRLLLRPAAIMVAMPGSSPRVRDGWCWRPGGHEARPSAPARTTAWTPGAGSGCGCGARVSSPMRRLAQKRGPASVAHRRSCWVCPPRRPAQYPEHNATRTIARQRLGTRARASFLSGRRRVPPPAMCIAYSAQGGGVSPPATCIVHSAILEEPTKAAEVTRVAVYMGRQKLQKMKKLPNMAEMQKLQKYVALY